MQTENKLGVMPISKLIWNMSLPIIASMLVQALYNIVDSMFVARICEQALTAVSLAFPAQNLMIGLATGTAVGMNALFGRALGAQEYHHANKIAMNGAFLAFMGFVVSAVAALCFARTFLSALTDIDYIVEQGTLYLHICCGCSIGIFGEIMFERFLQGTGRSILSMFSQGLGAITNIILDPIFIFDEFNVAGLTIHGFGKGVAGAAIATVIGQCVACVFSLILNLTKNPDVQLKLKGFRPNLRVIGSIYAIGLPSTIMIAVGSVMMSLMNKILIIYHEAHETAATAFGIYFKLNSFVFMPVFGMNNGLVPIVAYNYGAQNRGRLVETIKRGVIYVALIMLFGMGLFEVFPAALLRLFDATDTLIAVGTPALRIIALSFSFAGVCIGFGSSFQALGKSLYSMLTSIVRQLVVLIPAAFVLARYGAAIGNSDLVWWSYPIAEIFSLLMTLIFFRRIYKTIIVKLPLNGVTKKEIKEQIEEEP